MGVVLAVALAIVVSTLVLHSPADDDSEGVAGSQANVYVPPEPVPVTKKMRREINATLDRFVPAAVRRENPMVARSLATPGLRASATRKQWETGEIPVYPYDAKGSQFHGWTVNYSIPNNVNVDLMIQATDKEKVSNGIAYTVDLRRVRGRWLVESFFPTAEFRRVPAANGSRIVAQPDLAPTQVVTHDPTKDVTNRLIALVPLVIAALGLSLVIGVFFMQYIRGKRAERDYLAGRL